MDPWSPRLCSASCMLHWDRPLTCWSPLLQGHDFFVTTFAINNYGASPFLPPGAPRTTGVLCVSRVLSREASSLPEQCTGRDHAAVSLVRRHICVASCICTCKASCTYVPRWDHMLLAASGAPGVWYAASWLHQVHGVYQIYAYLGYGCIVSSAQACFIGRVGICSSVAILLSCAHQVRGAPRRQKRSRSPSCLHVGRHFQTIVFTCAELRIARWCVQNVLYVIIESASSQCN